MSAVGPTLELFVPGRLCLFGEHSDWAGGYRRFNSEVFEGCALVCGTSQGLYATARRLEGERPLLRYEDPSGQACEFELDDVPKLRQEAASASHFAYIAGTIVELSKHFRVGGAEIRNYKMDLPMKKGFSSSAAVCVLIARALNQLYDLKLTVHGEMDIAYRGEINTPSRCGRLDQCVAFGQTVTKMSFDGDLINTEPVRVAATLHFVVVDLCAQKDTKIILRALNEAYPYPKDAREKELHSLLGEVNLATCKEAIDIISQERNPTAAAERLGAIMTAAQARWDKSAMPLCPQELAAPTLHRLLDCPELKPHVTGGKGVGSQGDGSAQLLCRSEEAQAEVLKIVAGLGMEPLTLTIPASKPVRTAVVPIAGACPGMWPATKSLGAWFFPVRRAAAVKPAICWLCEELLGAGLERIILVVNEGTEALIGTLFGQREHAAVLNRVPAQAAAYDDTLLDIGRRVTCVRQDRPTGIRDALLLCERYLEGEPFVLAWGDHLCTSTAPDGKGCVAQMLAAFDGSRSVVSMHCIDSERVHVSGIYHCKEPPTPLPPPLGPRPASGERAVQTWPLAFVKEKPSREHAEEHLQTPCLGKGRFLASFGQFALTPSIMKILRGNPQEHFTDALNTLRQQEGLDGVLIEGSRWDLGNFSTYVEALQAQAEH